MAKKREIKDFHFFASSIGEWKVNHDVGELIATMKKHKLDFNLWKVPGDQAAHYEIRIYSPVVDGAVYLGQYRQINGKWQAYSRED